MYYFFVITAAFPLGSDDADATAAEVVEAAAPAAAADDPFARAISTSLQKHRKNCLVLSTRQ